MIYEIAGLRINIRNRCAFTTEFCKGYLSDDQTSSWEIEAEVSDEAFREERNASPGYSDGYIENICLYRAICSEMPLFNRFLLHAAILDYRGEGYAFLGRSGVGKSTHTSLWLKYLSGAKILNGDKPIVGYDGAFKAYGTPWQGKEGRGEKGEVGLKALCFLKQAKENAIRRMSVSETTDRLFTQLLIPYGEEGAAKTLELADRLISSVPAYLLECDISEEAVRVAFEGLTGRNYECAKTGGENA